MHGRVRSNLLTHPPFEKLDFWAIVTRVETGDE